VKESEIGYQMAFSRNELKRVIKEYPSKEVKKGLDALYKKVEKHLSEEENLLQVQTHYMLVLFCKSMHCVYVYPEPMLYFTIAGCLESYAGRIYRSV